MSDVIKIFQVDANVIVVSIISDMIHSSYKFNNYIRQTLKL